MRYFVTIKLRQDFVQVDGDTIVVGVRTAPEKGRANEELVKKLAEHFGISRSRVRIVTGGASRKKVVEIV